MDMGSKPELPFPSSTTLDHWLHFSGPPFPHLPNGDHGTDFLGWIRWDNSSAFIKHLLCARDFSGPRGASGEDQVMDTMELTFYRPWQEPWKQSKKKKIISRGNKSKKAWQEDAGTQCYCVLGVGVEELFWEAGIWAETQVKWGQELISGQGGSQCSSWGRIPPTVMQEQQGQVADMVWGDRRMNGRERSDMKQDWMVECSRVQDEVLKLESVRQLMERAWCGRCPQASRTSNSPPAICRTLCWARGQRWVSYTPHSSDHLVPFPSSTPRF